MERVPSEELRKQLELTKKLHQTTQRFFRQHAPQARESAQRLRVAMVESLSQSSGRAAAEAIGEYAIADSLNWDALIQRIDVILPPVEREKVDAVSSAWLAEQKTLGARMVEELRRQVPEFGQPEPSSDERAAAIRARTLESEREAENYIPQPSYASSTLVSHVLSSLDDVSWETSSPQAAMRLFKFSGPNHVSLRTRLRNSVLEAIATHRQQIGETIGHAAVSATSSGTSLSQELNMILTADERRSILAAFELFAAGQLAAQAEAARWRPDWEADEPPATESAEPLDPGAILWRALLIRGISITITTYPRNQP